MIVAAAIQINGVTLSIPKPARHAHILHQSIYFVDDTLVKQGLLSAQGFLTDTGLFLDSHEAMQHAIACNQPLLRDKNPSRYNGHELYSEDLWDGAA